MPRYRVKLLAGMSDVDDPKTKVSKHIVFVIARTPGEAQYKAIDKLHKKGYISVSADYPGHWIPGRAWMLNLTPAQKYILRRLRK